MDDLTPLKPPSSHGTPLLRILALLIFALLIAVLSSLGAYHYLSNQLQIQQSENESLIPSQSKKPPTLPTGYSYSCKSDNDCILINKEEQNICCGDDNCQPLDYSLEKWIAVNKTSYEETKKGLCANSALLTCRDCNPKAVNINFKASCKNAKCIKQPNKE